MEGLTKGRNVHYVHPNGTHSVATVTHIHNEQEGVVDLYVQRDDEIKDNYNAPVVVYSAEPRPYSWHFIEGEGSASVQTSLFDDAPKE